MDPFSDWYTTAVVVEKLIDGGTTDALTFQPPATLHGYVEQLTQLVRDADGSEVVSTASVWLPVTDAGKVTAGSRITIGARVTQVISVAETTGDQDLDGVAVMCA